MTSPTPSVRRDARASSRERPLDSSRPSDRIRPSDSDPRGRLEVTTATLAVIEPILTEHSAGGALAATKRSLLGECSHRANFRGTLSRIPRLAPRASSAIVWKPLASPRRYHDNHAGLSSSDCSNSPASTWTTRASAPPRVRVHANSSDP
jgi:hypothetical protein